MKKLLSAFLAIILVFTIMSPISIFAANGPYPFDPENEDILLSEFSALGLIDAETFDMSILYPVAEGFETPAVFSGATYNLETNTLTLNNVKCKTAMLSATEMGDDFKIELIGYNELGGILSDASTRGGSISIIGNGELVLNRTGLLGGIMIEAGESASKLSIAETVKMKLYYGEEFEAPAIYINDSTVTDQSELITIGGEISGEMPVVNNYIRDIYEQLEAYDLASNSLDFYDAGFIKDGVYYIGSEAYDEETSEPNGKYYLYALAYDEEFDFYVATDYANGEAVSVSGFTKLTEYDVLFDETNGFYIGYTFYADEGDNSYKTVFYPYMTDTFDLCVDENGTKYGFEQYPYEEEDENGNIESGVDTWIYNLIEHPVYGWIAEYDWEKDSLDGLTPIKLGEKELASVTLNSNLVINNGGSIIEPAKIKNTKTTSTNQGVKISWSADPAAEEYKIYRKASGETEWAVIDTVGADETFTYDKNVKSGKKYTYKVAGSNFVGEGQSSSNVTITYYASPKVSIKNTTKGVYLSWSKISGATKYKIYRQTSGSSKWTLIDTETGTSFTDKTAKSGKKYYYRVRAAKGDVMSGYNEVSKYFLSAPKLSSVKNSSSGVAVSWGKVTGAEGYKVYRKSGSGSYKYIGKTSKTAYTDTTAKSGTTYTYTVKAYKSKTDGAYNSTGLKLKYLAAPKAKATVYTNSISVSWSKVKSAKEYAVYRKASGESKYKKLTTTTKTSYKDTNVKNNKTYSYRVRAINGKTTSAYKTIKQLFLSTPKLSSVKNTNAGVKIKWSKVSGATSYRIYRKSGSGDFQLIDKTKKTTFTDDTAKSGTVYTYTVKACKDDATSYYNKTGLKIRFVDTNALYTPDNAKNGVHLRWEPANKADKYYVYRKLDGEKTFKQIDIVTADELKKDQYGVFVYVDKTAKNGKTYFYNLKASYKNTMSDYASTVGIPVTCMEPVDVTSAKATSSGIKIKWEKNSYATGYRVLRKEKDSDGGFLWYSGTVGSNATAYLDENVESGKTYEYAVQAIHDENNGKGGWSAPGGSKSAKAK